MSAVERTRRNRVRWLATATVLTLALLAMGAVHASQESHNRPRRCFALVRDWQDWSQTLLVAVPGDQRQAWVRLADECPLLILQACATPAQ
jgi:hypothetical protein